MEHGYIVTHGPHPPQGQFPLGDYAVLTIFEGEDDAADAVIDCMREFGGSHLFVKQPDSHDGHVVGEWWSPSRRIWLERLEIKPSDA